MKKQVLATGFFLLSFMFPLKVSAQNYDEIYVFGDSFSDTGNVFNVTDGAIPPSPTYFDGRFSNGPVWVEYLASNLGLTFNPNNNLAFGGATTGFNNISVAGLPGLQQQTGEFTAENSSANSDALYIVWAGANDYFNYFSGGVTNPTETLANLSTAVTSLAAVGAKDIMVVNLPDLGKFPVARFDSQSPNVLSALTSTHNSGLNATLNSWNQQLSPDVNIIPLDVNFLFNRIIAEPSEFGFTNVTDSCVGDLSIVPTRVTTSSVVCNPDRFLFWDEVHPTTATHQLIGKLAFSAVSPTPVPEPSTVLGVLVFVISITFSRLRQK